MTKSKKINFLHEIVEIYIAAKIFNIIIAIYEQLKFNSDFTPYSIFHPDAQIDECLIINFEKRNHYNLLTIKSKKKNKNNSENKYNDYLSKANKPVQVNINKNEIFFENEENNTNTKYINIGEKKIFMMIYIIF